MCFECDLAHRRSVAILCMLYKIRCNPMNPFYDALPVPCVPLRVTRCAVISHRYTYAPPRCRTSKQAGVLFPCQCLCGTILVTKYSMVWDWLVARAGPMHFYWPSCSFPFLSSAVFPFLFFILWVGIVGWGLRTDRVLIALSQPCITSLF